MSWLDFRVGLIVVVLLLASYISEWLHSFRRAVKKSRVPVKSEQFNRSAQDRKGAYWR